MALIFMTWKYVELGNTWAWKCVSWKCVSWKCVWLGNVWDGKEVNCNEVLMMGLE